MSKTDHKFSLWTLGRDDQGLCLRPTNSYAEMLFEGLYKIGDVLRVTVSKPRSPEHHRLYWAVLKVIVDGTDAWPTVKELHEAVKFHAGYVDAINLLVPHGRPPIVKYITQSIAFDKMDQAEFYRFFKKAMLAIEESTGIITDHVIADLKKRDPSIIEPWMRNYRDDDA